MGITGFLMPQVCAQDKGKETWAGNENAGK